MTDKQIYMLINKLYPFDLQAEWDQSKLYFAFFEKPVNQVVLCLDLTKAILDFALKTNAQLIVCHHPLTLDILNENKGINKKILQVLFEHKINLISCHTNFDCAKKGMNYFLLKKLGLDKITRVSNSTYALVGKLKQAETIPSLIASIKHLWNIEYVLFDKNDFRIINFTKVKKIALLAGAGASELATFKKKEKIEVFLTGEVKWHLWETAKLKKITVLQIPHSVEKNMINVMEKFFNSLNIKVFKCWPTTVFGIN